jgi:hypothetical protein
MYHREPGGKIKYNYNPRSSRMKQMDIDMWESIQCDPSDYSHYWENKEQFEPKRFAHNHLGKKKYNDVFFNILFWVNAIATLYLLYIAIKESKIDFLAVFSGSTGDSDPIFGSLCVIFFSSMLISNIVNTLHLCYAIYLPYFYVKSGILVNLVSGIVLSIVASIQNPYFLIFLPFSLVIGIIAYYRMRKYATISASILRQSSLLILRHRAIFLPFAVQGVIGIFVSLVFTLLAFLVKYNEWNTWIYAYLVFSFYWITSTFAYVTYMTIAGFVSTWYFLNGTPEMPKNPVLNAYKRALTTSFGAASLAGVILASIEALRFIIDKLTELEKKDDDSGDGEKKNSSRGVKIALIILRFVLKFILNILERFAVHMNHYGLIYCAIYGIPYKEGCRRWMEVSCKKHIDTLINGCVIGTAVNVNLIFFTVIAFFIGYFGTRLLADEIVAIAIISCSIVYTLAMFIVHAQTINAMSDTIFICFGEAPSRLRSSASELYDSIYELYQKKVTSKKSH